MKLLDNEHGDRHGSFSIDYKFRNKVTCLSEKL